MKNFLCRGKKGDLHMLLYVVKAMGGGNLYISEGEFEEPLESVIESSSKLVCAQKYIGAFEIHRGQPIDIDLSLFFRSSQLYRTTLLGVIAKAHDLDLPNPVEPWIDVPPDPRFTDKVILHRRCSAVKERVNTLFDWPLLLDTIGHDKCVFVSRLESEYEEFGFPDIAYHKPEDNFEHARAIKACRLFVGNQSFPSALADALGVNRIFELSYGIDRKHFAIRYAANAWYFASPWDCTLKNFRYVKTKNNGSYLDLATQEEIHNLATGYRFDLKTALAQEIHFRSKYHRLLAERFFKQMLGRL